MNTKKYTVVRSKRKTIALAVTVDASVIVRAPMRTSQSFIDRFLRANVAWIQRTLSRVRRLPRAARHEYKDGERFLYLGEYFPLRIVNAAEKLHLEDGFVLDSARVSEARALFESWYKDSAKKVITERSEHFAALHKLTFTSIKISAAQRRWGSCSAEGNLNFTWRLIMAPLHVVDYVVCHELAHVEHRNHSKYFWGRVAYMCPEYAQARKWLRQNGGLCHL